MLCKLSEALAACPSMPSPAAYKGTAYNADNRVLSWAVRVSQEAEKSLKREGC